MLITLHHSLFFLSSSPVPAQLASCQPSHGHGSHRFIELLSLAHRFALYIARQQKPRKLREQTMMAL